jgi:hypothetical protein
MFRKMKILDPKILDDLRTKTVPPWPQHPVGAAA